MKYIKTYEKLDISQSEKDINNLVKNLKYNLIKYFDDSVYSIKVYKAIIKTDGYDDLGCAIISDARIYIIYYNFVNNKKSSKEEALKNELKNLGTKFWNGYDSSAGNILTIDQAKDLLSDLKSKKIHNDAIKIEIKKYNL